MLKVTLKQTSKCGNFNNVLKWAGLKRSGFSQVLCFLFVSLYTLNFSLLQAELRRLITPDFVSTHGTPLL